MKRIQATEEIDAILKTRFGIEADVQVVHPNGENRILYEIEHIPFSQRMTLAGLERLCRRIAKALSAEICGCVNVDFDSLCTGHTFDLLLEVLHKSETRPH